jgi:hypothetical protein
MLFMDASPGSTSTFEIYVMEESPHTLFSAPIHVMENCWTTFSVSWKQAKENMTANSLLREIRPLSGDAKQCAVMEIHWATFAFQFMSWSSPLDHFQRIASGNGTLTLSWKTTSSFQHAPPAGEPQRAVRQAELRNPDNLIDTLYLGNDFLDNLFDTLHLGNLSHPLDMLDLGDGFDTL